MFNNEYEGSDASEPVEKIKNAVLHNIKPIIAGIVLLIVVFGAFFQVEPEEVGVITRFGKT